jgi:SAM-dependent methyltransferase
MMGETDLRATYRRRFSPDLAFRQEMWHILCGDFFQRFIPPNASVMEIGAGYCEFINNVQAGSKIAVDLNPDTQAYAAPDVTVIATTSTNLEAVANGSVDVVFASNFFEHLSRDDIVLTLRAVARTLRPDGRLLILQPNYRYCYRDYWMFFDHITPLDDRSLTEALETNGYHVVRCLARFLPYTTESRLPKSLALIKLYLRLPLAWRFFGQQAFVVAARQQSATPQL